MAQARLSRVATALFAVAIAIGVACQPTAAPKTTAEIAAESLERGVQADTAGRVDEAITAYFQVLSNEPKNKFAFYNLGQVYRRANELVIAEGYYRQALKVDPNFVAALFGYGFTRLAAADWAEAERANKAVTAAEPQNAPAWFNLGLALQNQSKQTEATQAFQRARQIDPNLTPPPAPTPRPSGR